MVLDNISIDLDIDLDEGWWSQVTIECREHLYMLNTLEE